MVLSEKIKEYIQKLPEAFQQEVLDYLEFLLTKTDREEKEWSHASLKYAIRGMEQEPEIYSISDIKARYS